MGLWSSWSHCFGVLIGFNANCMYLINLKKNVWYSLLKYLKYFIPTIYLARMCFKNVLSNTWESNI